MLRKYKLGFSQTGHMVSPGRPPTPSIFAIAAANNPPSCVNLYQSSVGSTKKIPTECTRHRCGGEENSDPEPHFGPFIPTGQSHYNDFF